MSRPDSGKLNARSDHGVPLVSVVTIFCNAEKFLAEAVESVLGQVFGDWELLLIDDGSTDGSSEIAVSYARRHPCRVHYFQHEGHRNKGMSAARNLGIERAKGRYISFLDADDVWLPHRLQEQVAILETSDVGLIYGNREYWVSWQSPDAALPDKISTTGFESDGLVPPPCLLTRIYEEGRATNPGSDITVRKDVAMRVGGFENAFTGMFEDQVFLVKVLLMENTYVSGRCWSRYRQHAQSCVARTLNSSAYRHAHVAFLRWFESYLEANEMRDSQLFKAIQSRRRRAARPLLGRTESAARHILAGMLPRTARKQIKAYLVRHRGFRSSRLRFGNLRRLTPVSEVWGFDRGLPLDRYYIENFLKEHRSEIMGHVLEIQDDAYAVRFGDGRVRRIDILDVNGNNPKATIVADLVPGSAIPADTFDCIILTQTLQCVYDLRAAVGTLHRILRPGGIVLATFPGISRACLHHEYGFGDYWHMTRISASRLFADCFGPGNVAVRSYGNVLAAIAFLEGLAAHELSAGELDYCDPRYQVSIAVRAVKAGKGL